MKVLVACEFSGVVRDAFIRAGHDAWSCDLLPSESEGESNRFRAEPPRSIADQIEGASKDLSGNCKSYG